MLDHVVADHQVEGRVWEFEALQVDAVGGVLGGIQTAADEERKLMRGDVVPKMALGRHVKHVAAAQLRQDIEPIEIEAQVPLAIVGAAVRTPEAFYVRADRIEPNDELRERCGRMLPREPRVD